jgi:CDP-glycerol glycerophosphotransferase (TagB/SpsB family)
MKKVKNLLLRIVRLLVRYSAQIIVLFRFHNTKRDYSIWVCGEWFGERGNDNVFYLANYIAQNESNVKLYWVSVDPLKRMKGLHQNISVLPMDSTEAKMIFQKAGVVLMGQSFYDFSKRGFNYFSGAITVNLWHGLAWKKIGPQESPKGMKRLWRRLIVRKLFQAEHVLCSSSKHIEVMQAAFNVTDENFIKCGQPRNEFFHNKSEVKKVSQTVRSKLGFSSQDKLVAYLPTFRANEHQFSIDENLALKKDQLDFSNIKILTKLHHVDLQKEISRSATFSVAIDISDFNTQEILAAADVLITDYSGVFFDFLLLDRPIVHLLTDYTDYVQRDRGLYFEVETIEAGLIVWNEEYLAEAILTAIDHDKKSELRNYKRSIFQDYEISGASKQLSDFIFHKIKLRNNK